MLQNYISKNCILLINFKNYILSPKLIFLNVSFFRFTNTLRISILSNLTLFKLNSDKNYSLSIQFPTSQLAKVNDNKLVNSAK